MDEDGKQLVASGDMANNVELGGGGSELIITTTTADKRTSKTLGSREFLRYYRQKPRPSPANHMAITAALASRFVCTQAFKHFNAIMRRVPVCASGFTLLYVNWCVIFGTVTASNRHYVLQVQEYGIGNCSDKRADGEVEGVEANESVRS